MSTTPKEVESKFESELRDRRKVESKAESELRYRLKDKEKRNKKRSGNAKHSEREKKVRSDTSGYEADIDTSSYKSNNRGGKGLKFYDDYDIFRHPSERRRLPDGYEKTIESEKRKIRGKGGAFFNDRFDQPLVEGSDTRKFPRRRIGVETPRRMKNLRERMPHGYETDDLNSSEDSENDYPNIGYRGVYLRDNDKRVPEDDLSEGIASRLKKSKSTDPDHINMALSEHTKKTDKNSPYISFASSIKPASHFSMDYGKKLLDGTSTGKIARVNLDYLRQNGYGIADTTDPEVFYGEKLYSMDKSAKWAPMNQELDVYAPKGIPKEAILGWYNVKKNISKDEYRAIKDADNPLHFARKFNFPIYPGVKLEPPVRHSYRYEKAPWQENYVKIGDNDDVPNVGRSNRYIDNAPLARINAAIKMLKAETDKEKKTRVEGMYPALQRLAHPPAKRTETTLEAIQRPPGSPPPIYPPAPISPRSLFDEPEYDFPPHPLWYDRPWAHHSPQSPVGRPHSPIPLFEREFPKNLYSAPVLSQVALPQPQTLPPVAPPPPRTYELPDSPIRNEPYSPTLEPLLNPRRRYRVGEVPSPLSDEENVDIGGQPLAHGGSVGFPYHLYQQLNENPALLAYYQYMRNR